MIATTKSPSRCQLLFAAVMLLASSWLALAEPVGSVANARGVALVAATDPTDAQAYCAGPVHRFSRVLSKAMAAQGVDDELRSQFLRNLKQCREVYRYQLQQLADEFGDLPADAYCHSVLREFVESESLFDIAEVRANQLPLSSEEERLAAGMFFRHASPALARAVNGLFLLRHGICREERIAPLVQPPMGSRINQTYPHIE